MSDKPVLVDQPKATKPSEWFTRKVWAMVWTTVGAVVLAVLLIILRETLLPGVQEMNTLIGAILAAIPLLIAAVVAAWKTKERDTSRAEGT